VRVKLLGVPMGVKASGGILDQVLREVEIECLPADIPSHIDADVSQLELHGVLRVGGLPHSEKIKYMNSEDATVAHVVSIREEAPTAAETEAAATAAAAAATAAEPEVAKKGKTDDAAKKPDAAAAKKPEAKK
jgi:large subunit ribosomal protein L25